MADMYFNIETTSEIIIYGANARNFKLGEALNRQGYHVRFYIDRNAHQIKAPVSVYTLNEFLEKSKSADVIIIIVFQNAIQQEQTAKNLFNRGYDKLIFLPMFLGNEVNRTRLRNIYDAILSFQFGDLTNIPSFSELISTDASALKLKETKDFIVVNLPIDVLFTDTIADENPITGEQFLKVRRDIQKRYSDRPIYSMQHYFALFKYLDKGTGDCREYLQLQFSEEYPSAQKVSKILRDRYQLFQIYEAAFEGRENFFAESAIPVKWNEKGYFNIKDGHHRAVYLIYKGYHMLPVSVSKKDWANYYNEQLLKAIPSHIFSAYPIAHITSIERRKMYVCIRLSEKIIDFFRGEEFSPKTILDISRYKYYILPTLSRNFDYQLYGIESDADIKPYFKQIIRIATGRCEERNDIEGDNAAYDYIFVDEQTLNQKKEKLFPFIKTGWFVYEREKDTPRTTLAFYRKDSAKVQIIFSFCDLT